ncbi:PepSY-associated TM helix domain-containing protein [Luteolibacter luteus]|uniref:PepSY domain-containing protein n=1 Tax=Luteolibacter luteus TaxID=2728835 RepID=A0A858RD06_9BACT|nr:PepSY-associated TM helix domain-containing protein [Luteolibacter luteus]QJE94677.1 PepSY domain-containing protein [Luteolibacter luteus]
MFRPFRKILFWLHLVAGVAAGLVILVMATSGTLLSFERQITESVDGYQVSMPIDVQKKGPEELFAALQAAEPGAAPTGMVVSYDPTQAVAFQFGKEKTLFLNPYSGEVLGEGAKGTRGFFQFVTGVHRWLAMKGESQKTGQAITSAAAVVFFFLILSGLVLWIPKRWTRRGLKVITLPQGGLKGRAWNWSWHNVLGFWFALPLLVICTTGLVIAYPWANALLFRAVGEEAPPPKGPPGGGKPGMGGRGPGSPQAGPVSTAGWNRAFEFAKESSETWKSIQFQFPQGKEAIFNVFDGHRGRPDLKQMVTVDLSTGELRKIEKFEEQSRGRQLRQWVRWAHTGEAGSWIGQAVAGLSAAAAVMLVWTGLALAWRRFFKKKSTVEAPLAE